MAVYLSVVGIGPENGIGGGALCDDPIRCE